MLVWIVRRPRHIRNSPYEWDEQTPIDIALDAIREHPCPKDLSNLMLGGDVGCFGVLRGVELLRRLLRAEGTQERLELFFHAVKDKLPGVLLSPRITLEMAVWQRWTIGTIGT